MTSNDNPDARPKKKFDLVSLKQENKLDIWLSINYLARANKGIQDFIVNHFYSFDDQVVEFFLPQLCNLALKEADPQTLVRFLMDKCSSLHLAVKMFFWFQAAVEDKVFPPTRTSWLWHECEMAAVNSKSRSTLRVETYNLNSQGQGFTYMSPSVYRLPEIALKSPGKSRHQRSASMPTITLETTSNNTVSPRSSKIPHSSSELPHNVILSKSEDTTVTKNNIEADCSPGTSEPSSPRGETRENSMHSSTELVPEATPEQPEPSSIATESTESIPDTTLDQSTDSTSVAKESCTEPSPVASSEHPTETLVTSNDSTSTTTELTTETLATSNETPQKTFLSSAMKIPSSSSMSDLTSAATLPPTEVLAQSTSSESTPIGSPRDLRETGSGSNITENNVDEKKLYRRSLPPENDQKNGLSKIVEITADELHFSTKKARHHFFHQQIQFISGITEISNILKRRGARSKTENNRELFQLLKQLQQEIVVPSVENNIVEMALAGAPLNQGVFLPIHIANGMYYRVLRVLPGDSFCLSSRDRVPYMIFVETVGLKEDPYDFAAMSETTSQVTMDINNTSDSETPATSEENSEGIIKVIDEVMAINREQMNSKRKMSTEDEDWVVLQDSVPGEEELSPTLRLAYPEYWAEKEARIRRTSPYGTIPGWKLHSVIVKSGDDLRQEQLAVQLISTFNKIFRKAEVPLWIYPYSVVATSSDGGLIETVPDAISLDTLKKRIPNAKTLEDYFISAYGERTSIKFLQAQRNFVESLAAYSLVCYLLQIKDRHNGNILLSKEGHVIHIDYGFMLTSSPGSLGFETAPFKLTDEFIKLMGGDMSDMANYFKLLLIRGFLEVRKHCSKILLLVETLLPGHKMRCFARRETVIRELKDRFRLELSDKECIAFVGDLIKQSARNWTTGSYDNYQYYLNGILV